MKAAASFNNFQFIVNFKPRESTHDCKTEVVTSTVWQAGGPEYIFSLFPLRLLRFFLKQKRAADNSRQQKAAVSRIGLENGRSRRIVFLENRRFPALVFLENRRSPALVLWQIEGSRL